MSVPKPKREPHDNIPAKVALIQVGAHVVELAEAVTLSDGGPWDGPRQVYLDAARGHLADIRASLDQVETYLVAAGAERARIDVPRQSQSTRKRGARK